MSRLPVRDGNTESNGARRTNSQTSLSSISAPSNSRTSPSSSLGQSTRQTTPEQKTAIVSEQTNEISTVETARLIRYPETPDLPSLTEEVRRNRPRTGIVIFSGTVKVRGTQATMIFRPGQSPRLQSHDHVITPQDSATAAFLEPNIAELRTMVECAVTSAGFQNPQEIMVAGQFAGTELMRDPCHALAKQFYAIFAIRVDGSWLHAGMWTDVHMRHAMIYNVYDFGTFQCIVDFTPPGTAKGGEIVCSPNNLFFSLVFLTGTGQCLFRPSEIDNFTRLEERPCPSGLTPKNFHNSLSDGIVWTQASAGPQKDPLRFKSEKRRRRSKWRTTRAPKENSEGATSKEVNKTPNAEAAVTSRAKLRQGLMKVIDSEKAKKAEDFVKDAVTIARLRQGLLDLRQLAGVRDGEHSNSLLDPENVIPLSEWIMDDLTEEERSELQDIGLTKMDIFGEAKARAKEFLLSEKKVGYSLSSMYLLTC